MADRAEYTGADEEVDEGMDDQNQNQIKVQEWMAHACDDILDISCVHFHEEFKRHHDELLEALWEENYMPTDARMVPMDADELNILEVFYDPAPQPGEGPYYGPLHPKLVRMRLLRAKLWFFEKHFKRSTWERSQIRRLVTDSAAITVNEEYFDRQLALLAWHFDEHRPSSIVKKAKICIQIIAASLNDYDFNQWKKKEVNGAGRRADHLAYWGKHQDPAEMPYVLDLYYLENPVPREYSTESPDHSIATPAPPPVITSPTEEERIPIEYVAAIVNDDDIQKVLAPSPLERNTLPESSSSYTSERKNVGPFSRPRRSALTPERTLPREMERSKVTPQFIDFSLKTTTRSKRSSPSPSEKEDAIETEKETVQPISLMILADGKTYNIVKRRVSDEARREDGGATGETKRRRSDTPEPSGRQFDLSSVALNPVEASILPEGSADDLRKMLEKGHFDPEQVQLLKELMVNIAQKAQEELLQKRNYDDNSVTNSSSSTLSSAQGTPSFNSPTNVMAPISIVMPANPVDPGHESASSLLMMAPSTSVLPLQPPALETSNFASTAQIEMPSTSYSTDPSNLPWPPGYRRSSWRKEPSTRTSTIPPIQQFRPNRAASPPVFCIDWNPPRTESHDTPGMSTMNASKRMPLEAPQPVAIKTYSEQQVNSNNMALYEAEQKKCDERMCVDIMKKMDDVGDKASLVEFREMEYKLLILQEIYKDELLGTVSKNCLEKIRARIEEMLKEERKEKAVRDREQRKNVVAAVAQDGEYEEDDDERNTQSNLSLVKKEAVVDEDCMITYYGPTKTPTIPDGNKKCRRKRNEDGQSPPVDNIDLRCSSSADVMDRDVRAALLLAPFFVQHDDMEEEVDDPSDYSAYAMFPSLGVPVPQDISPAKVIDECIEEQPLGDSNPQDPPAEEEDGEAPLAGGSDEDPSLVEWSEEDVMEEVVETSFMDYPREENDSSHHDWTLGEGPNEEDLAYLATLNDDDHFQPAVGRLVINDIEAIETMEIKEAMMRHAKMNCEQSEGDPVSPIDSPETIEQVVYTVDDDDEIDVTSIPLPPPSVADRWPLASFATTLHQALNKRTDDAPADSEPSISLSSGSEQHFMRQTGNIHRQQQYTDETRGQKRRRLDPRLNRK